MTTMAEKILFVDDEPAVLDGYKRILYRDFAVDTAIGGELGLVAMRQQGPYAVVVSDMRMPGMNGAQFLSHVRQEFPDTTRMLLTGHADIQAVMEAVNDGNIFRFLTKPCGKPILTKALNSGIAQNRLLRVEKELLENTLMGSIRVLTDVLGAVNPEAFGRSLRIARCVRHLATKIELTNLWLYEAAAMLSQLGCVTLDPEMIQAAYLGTQLSEEDKARFEDHPRVARELLVKIPRLEPVAWMIGQQSGSDNKLPPPEYPQVTAEDMVTGAKMLKLAVAFDDLCLRGSPEEEAIACLRVRAQEFTPALVDALRDLKPEGAKIEVRKVLATKLGVGMILKQEIRTQNGILVVAKGQEITQPLLLKLENFVRAGTIEKEILVLV